MRSSCRTDGLARLLLAGLLALACVQGPVHALSADEKSAKEVELGRVAENRRLNEERIEALRREVAEIAKDRSALSASLLETASTIKAHETELTASEERLSRLADNEAGIRASLGERRGVLAALLGAMQRLGRAPPPAVLVGPDDALASLRAALLMGAIMPELKIEAETLASDLGELVALRRRMDAERGSQQREIARLAEEQEKLQLLLDEKGRQEIASKGELTSLEERAAELASTAKSLEELVAKMDAELAEREKVREKATAMAPAAGGAMAALHDPMRMEPAVPFASAKARLSLPASGVRLKDYGDAEEFGGVTKGISIATRTSAQVTAPADGWVVYAGPFRSYGQLLIINPGGGYHILLAGMERVNVNLGQFVLAGEPVAVMGGRLLASTAAFVPGSDQPVLYVEFRKDGAAIDPSPWWAPRSEKVRG